MTQSELYERLAGRTGEEIALLQSYGFREMNLTLPRKHRKRRHRHPKATAGPTGMEPPPASEHT